MSTEESDHRSCVDAWMERVASGRAPDRLVAALEEAFAVLWRRAHQTLGDVTLTAIVERVLYNAAEQYPFFSTLTVDAGALRSEGLRESESAGNLDKDQLAEGTRFVLVEFLSVLGNLTADILTPKLHEEIARLPPAKRAPPAKASRGARRPKRRGGKDPKS